MASRKASHKMKSAFDERGKRLLRVHRRSLDQREMRQEEINRRRQIDDMSPVVESQDASKNPSTSATPVNQSAAVSRLEKLKKWKEERELKRKLEAMEKAKSKPGFKVLHVLHKDTHLYKKNANVKDTAKPASVKPVPAVAPKATKPRTVAPAPPTSKATTVKSATKTTNHGTAKTTSTKRTADAPQAAKKPDALPATTRTTRSRGATATKTVSDVPQEKVKQSPPKRSTRSNFMAPTAASRTRAVATTKKEPPAATGKRKAGPTARTLKDKGGVSAERGGGSNPAGQQSFAPRDFVFEAPGSVQSFVFKPLSPASAASFLFPQAGANPDSTTMSAFTTRVGRTSTPKRDGQPSSSSEEDTSDELKRSADVKEPVLGSGRGSCSKPKNSCVTPDGSQSLAGKKPATERLGSGLVADSGVEVNTAGIDSVNMKTLAQNSADNATSSEEDLHTSEQESSPRKSRKGRRQQESVSKALDTEYISEQEKPTDVSEAEGAIAEEATSSSTLQSRKGKRKSKRVTIQEDLTIGAEDSKAEVSAAKQRRKSRRSTIKSESVIESESENVQESLVEVSVSQQPSLSEKATEEQETPRKSRRSRRSTIAKSKDEQDHETTATRKSRRSNLTNADRREDSETADSEDLAIVEEDAEKAKIHSKARRSRRSVAKQQEDPVKSKDVTPAKEKPSTSTKMETDEEHAHSEIEIPEPSTPENRRHNLRGARAKDDMFLTPGPPVSSQKHSTAKRRRRTATMIALSSAKSPEEAIKIIATSPMVEMTRRTPKTKISPELRNQSTALVFDDSDFALAPLQLSSAFDAVSTDATRMDDATTSADVATSVKSETAGDSLSTGSTSSEVQESCNNDDGMEKRDVTPFRERLSAEIQKLTELSKHWTAIRENNKDLSEEVEGQVRTTVCQAQLLMDRKGKFHQFAGLVDKCEAGDPSTTCQDLQGFWDMIFMQAEDIYSKFERLEQLQQNNWQPDLSEVQASSQPAKKKKPVTGGSKKQKTVGKSKFAAFKAQMMKQRKAQETGDAAVSDVPEEKVFDAGFFKVNSPVRTLSYHCEAGTPSKRSSSTASESTKDPSRTPTTSRSCNEPAPATPTASPKTTDNKENVAQVFLRRSMGAIPGRRSYVPTVPSPLLKDGTPTARSPPLSPSKATNSAARTSEGGEAVEGMEKATGAHTPVRPRRSLAGRRSTCGRKSVSFLERSEGEGEGVQQDEGVDMMAYLQPSTSQPTSPLTESVMEEGSPFSTEDILKHSKPDTPVSASPGRQQKNSLKTLPSSERRRSRRSVHFAASTNTPEGAFALPSTPYNKNSLVAGKRVTRRSTSGHGHDEQSALSELQELSATPPARRSARPSLLYTPPKVDNSKPKAPAREVPVATLISLSPSGQ